MVDANPRRRRRIVFGGGALLGAALFFFLLSRYDFRSVFAPILHGEPLLLLAVMGLQAVIQLLNAFGPVILLGPLKRHPARWRRTRVFLALQPLGLFAPARLGDFGAVPLLKYDHHPGAVASSIVIDRLITVLFLLLMSPLALRMAWPAQSSTVTTLAIIAGIVLVAAGPFLLISRRARSVANQYVLRLWPSLLEGFGAHIEFLLHTSRTRLLLNLALTALKTLLAGAAIALLARNVGAPLSLPTAFWMSVLTQLATSLPIAPQGLGIAEGSLLLLFEVNGLSGALALAVGILGRVLFIPVIVAIYLLATLPVIAERIEQPTDDTEKPLPFNGAGGGK